MILDPQNSKKTATLKYNAGTVGIQLMYTHIYIQIQRSNLKNMQAVSILITITDGQVPAE